MTVPLTADPSGSAFVTAIVARPSGVSVEANQWVAGYATGMFGKWHLGDTPGRFPTDQGFDVWYGIPNTTDESLYSSHPQFDPAAGISPEIMESRRGAVPTVVEDYDLDARRRIDGEITDRTIAFMREQAEAARPFFAYVLFTHAHLPTLAHPDFEGTTGHGAYADVTAEIDHRAGQVLDAIDELGIRENTIVIWVLPPIFTAIVEFQRSLVAEPPINLGTPDPYEPSR